MRVDKIEINNFKSIKNLVIDFKEISGLWKLGGNVGAGKTSIGEAILYGMFGEVKGKNNGDLVSWGEKSGSIKIWIESMGRNIYIERILKLQGQTPLNILVDSEPITFTNKRDAQQILENEYYDTSKMMIELLCIISFNNFKSLSSLNASDSKKFLDQVFGFSALTTYQDNIKTMKFEVQKNINNIYIKKREKLAQINKIKEMESKKIDVNIANENIYNNNIKKLREKNNEFLKQNTPQLESEKTYLNTILSEKSSITIRGKQLAKDIQFIEKGICPTCGAKVDQSSLNELKTEKQELRDKYLDIITTEDVVKLKINNIENEIKNINIKTQKKIAELEKELYKISLCKQNSHISNSEVDTLNSEVLELDNELEQLDSEVRAWDDLLNILSNDVRTKIIKSFLPLLNSSILQYSQQLQQPYTIEFDRDFKCNLTLPGVNNIIPISSLSTGQLKTVDISIILGTLKAIINSIEFNICFLDELISNMDEELRSIICKVLKNNITKNQSVFVISHMNIDESYFDGIVEAELDGPIGGRFSNYQFRFY